MYSFQCLALLKAPTFCHIQVLLYHFVDKTLSKSYVPLLGLPASPFGFGILPLSPHSDSSDDSVDSEGEGCWWIEHLSLQGKYRQTLIDDRVLSLFDRGGAKDGNSHPLSSGPLFKACLVYRVLATCIEKYAGRDCPIAASPLKRKASEDEDNVTPAPKRVTHNHVPVIRPGGKVLAGCIEKYAGWDCPVAASPLKHKASEDEDDVTPVPKRVARDCVPIIRPGGKCEAQDKAMEPPAKKHELSLSCLIPVHPRECYLWRLPNELLLLIIEELTVDSLCLLSQSHKSCGDEPCNVSGLLARPELGALLDKLCNDLIRNAQTPAPTSAKDVWDAQFL
ncbi:hypothetical protein BU15DRAFT_66140 [Melanogaster broomeanus]|nr:hypothetical protein BU15DRAFT_66140 [Melanogaster broomeanus]